MDLKLLRHVLGQHHRPQLIPLVGDPLRAQAVASSVPLKKLLSGAFQIGPVHRVPDLPSPLQGEKVLADGKIPGV